MCSFGVCFEGGSHRETQGVEVFFVQSPRLGWHPASSQETQKDLTWLGPAGRGCLESGWTGGALGFGVDGLGMQLCTMGLV